MSNLVWELHIAYYFVGTVYQGIMHASVLNLVLQGNLCWKNDLIHKFSYTKENVKIKMFKMLCSKEKKLVAPPIARFLNKSSTYSL